MYGWQTMALTDRHGAAIFLPVAELLGRRDSGASTLLDEQCSDEMKRSRRVAAGEELMETQSGQPCVLLVDDYLDARQMYTAYLEYSGFAVVQAANGVEALREALKSRPDIILMDLSLPVMDGWEAMRQLKADPRTANIPVVALTGQSLRNADGAREVGCEAFLTKPCLPEDLVQEIRRVLA
jgi:two-component system cell cycle response regulator DivK